MSGDYLGDGKEDPLSFKFRVLSNKLYQGASPYGIHSHKIDEIETKSSPKTFFVLYRLLH
jgi:hypothetical protein